ncbi:MAG: C25 family cysteine peptidase [Candidatus Cloacimonadota bacterium]|nr:C25 family cysteine peptidase [Candidatus Cloacimonadota bacterium]
MKKFIAFVLLVFFIGNLSALNIEINENQVNFRGNFKLEKQIIRSGKSEDFLEITISECGSGAVPGKADLPIYSKLFSLPNRGNFVLQNISYDYKEITLDQKIQPFCLEEGINYNEEYYSTDEWFPQELVKIGKPVIMRGYRFSQISISAVQYNPAKNRLRILKNIDADFKIDFSKNVNPILKQSHKISLGFSDFAEKNIMGVQNDRGEISRNYLFICPDACASILQPLVKWKEKLSYHVKVVKLSEAGTTSEEIKAYLQNAYDNWENPPDYVILFGDVTGQFAVPAFYVEGGPYSPWDVTDHSYALLEGDDYFPDIFIGRISFLSLMELVTVINKIISYEQNPYIAEDWFKHALMVGYVDAQWNYFSPYETLMEVRNKLINFGYTQVDTFIAPYYTSPQQLANWINTAGYTFINYRGSGSPNHWGGSYGGSVGSLFSNDNIEQDLSNGYMLPLITSLTCGGGNFADDGYPSCFGELWLKVGSPSTPRGAIGFIGPSEYDTKTQFNNTNDMGIYQGITQEGINRCGEIMLRGKMALYNNYPNLLEMGEPCYNVPFYFYVYNLLGDPGIAIWTDTPQEIELSCNDTISYLDNYVQVNIENSTEKSDFIIAITNEDSLFSTAITDSNGMANIPTHLAAGTYYITASKYGFIPQTDTLIVSQNNILALNGYSFSEDPISGAEISLETILQNFQLTELHNITFSLSCSDDYIEILTDSIFVPSILSQNFVELTFDIRIGNEWENGFDETIFLNAVNNEIDEDYLIPIIVNSAEMGNINFSFLTSDSTWLIGAENIFKIGLKNIGSLASNPFEAVLCNNNSPIEVGDSISVFENIAVNDSAFSENAFSVFIQDSLIDGEFIDLRLKIFQNDVLVQTIDFSERVGQINSESPTFGSGGYLAIESSDFGNFESPEYEWIEIDPNYGGNGNLIEGTYVTSDGYISTIQLPHPFSYYSKFYSEMSVCSNGYISMGETNQIFFRNKIIPSGVGSQAMIAPFWDHLIEGEIYSYYDSEKERLIIEWSRFQNVYNPDVEETFQVIFQYADNDSGASIFDDQIIFQYKEIGNVDQEENYATTGIENYSQTSGLLISYSNIQSPTAHPYQNETAILFKRRNVSNFPLLICEPEEILITLNQDKTINKQISVQNSSEDTELLVDVSLSHFRKNSTNKGFDYNRNLENDTLLIASNCGYIPYIEQNFSFYLLHSNGSEPIVHVSLDFPDGVTILAATDLGELSYNGETGGMITWGNGTEILYDTGINAFGITTNIEVGISTPIDINWEIQGDGTGSPPHSKSGIATILPAEGSYLWITHPDLNDQLVYGLTDSITWVDWGEVISPINLEISFDGGINWEILAEAIDNEHHYYFTVPAPLSDNCRVRITDLESSILDNSANFSITALNITYPNANSIMEYGSQDSIRWIDCGGIENVNIDISSDGGYIWENIAENFPNEGIYEFIVPGLISNNCKIRLTDSNGDVFNTSSGFFEITDSPIGWLTCDYSGGFIPAGETTTFNVTLSSQNLEIGEYSAFIKIKSDIGQVLRIPVILIVQENPLPDENFLGQNIPNPIDEWTSIPFSLKQPSPNIAVVLNIYNVKGQLVRTLEYNNSRAKSEDQNYFLWDTKDMTGHKVSTGVYFYRLKIGDTNVKTKKCLLMR